MLSAEEHKYLDPETLKILRQNKISSVLEYVNEDVHKLSTITKLQLSQIMCIRNDLLKKYSALPIKGGQLLETIQQQKHYTWGIESLNSLLQDGLPMRYIMEICGLAGSGKTQLCFALMLNVLQCDDCTILYVDTKGDFTAIRIQKMLHKKGCTNKDMANIMDRLKIVRVWNMCQIVELFSQLKLGEISFKNLRMIVVDSLPSLMFQHLDDVNKDGLKLLNKLVNLMNYLSKELNLIVVIVNILTRWVEQSCLDNEDINNTASSSVENESMWIEKKQRCLGKYWQHIPALVLQLERNPNMDHAVKVNLIKSAFSKSNVHCWLKLNEFGITYI